MITRITRLLIGTAGSLSTDAITKMGYVWFDICCFSSAIPVSKLNDREVHGRLKVGVGVDVDDRVKKSAGILED